MFNFVISQSEKFIFMDYTNTQTEYSHFLDIIVYFEGSANLTKIVHIHALSAPKFYGTQKLLKSYNQILI